MGLDIDSFNDALKSHYTKDRIKSLVHDKRPFLALVPKMTDFGGRDDLPIPLEYGGPQGGGATFSDAQAGADTTVLISAFKLARVSDHQIQNIGSEVIEASKGDANSFMEAQKTTVNSMIRELSNRIALKMYRGGTGCVGRIAVGGASGSTITLTNAADSVFFMRGMKCVFADTEFASTLRNSGAGLTVASVNRALGTVTFTTALSGESVVAGDYVFSIYGWTRARYVPGT